jgi:hypothetical protein
MTEPISPPGRLGWTPAPPDPRTLRLEAYTTADLPPAPKAASWMRRVGQWPMLGNDRIGDCVLVTCAHLVQGWTAYAGTEYRMPEPDVVGAYAAITGYNPATGAGDDGTRSLDALNFWRRTGIGGHQITAYVQVNPHDLDAVKAGMYLFGGLFVAVDMPRAAATQFRQRKTWTTVPGGDGVRGSWGGHAMHAGSYGTTGVTFSTWGRTQRASWHWWNTYVAETYAIVSPDWLDQAAGRSPTGFDLNGLLADLHRITT